MAEEIKQLDIFDFLPKAMPKYGDRGCHVCSWWNKKEDRCQWETYKFERKNNEVIKYPDCAQLHSFEPSTSIIPRMCGNCIYSNDFEYQTKEEYLEDEKKHNGYSRKAADDPVEEPNIYCTHPEGSLNRRTDYKDCEEEGFGIGHWNRQHEWDTCDRWKLDKEFHKGLEGATE